MNWDFDALTVPAPPAGINDWNDEGVIRLDGFLDNPHGHEIMDAYCTLWMSEHTEGNLEPPWRETGGWPDPIPYMRFPEILNLLEPFASVLEETVGEPMGLHLNLTGWVTTERNWHQDSYLNPPHVGDHYAALWIALEDIDPDSGPFQYVPGSHRWPQVTRERIWEALGDHSSPDWPTRSERILTPAFEAELEKRQPEIVTYLPKRGDALIWHGRLLHRGSKANVPGMPRQAIISHFSGVRHRQDMPMRSEHGRLTYFVLNSR
jgi:hypothetical protein